MVMLSTKSTDLRFALGLIALALVLGCSKQSEPPEKQAGDGRVVQELDKVRASLQEALEKSQLGITKPCDEARLKRVLKGATAKVVLVTQDQLGRVISGESGKAKADHEFLETKKLPFFDFSPKDEYAAVLALSKFKERQSRYPFIAVVDIKEFRAPASKGSEFVPGQSKGVITIFELGKAEPWCGVAYEATSAGEVAQRAKEERSTALRKDFENQMKETLRNSVLGLSSYLSP